MKQNKIKQNYFRKYFPIFFLVVFCFLSLITPRKAMAWDAIEGAIFKQALENLQKTIDGISLAAAKQAAMKMILEEIDKMFQDFYSAGDGIITDWEDYLIGAPERESAAFMNDLLSDITQGRSSTRYRSVPVATTLSYAEAYEGFGAKNAVQFALIKSARAEDEYSLSESYATQSYPYAQFLKNAGQTIVKGEQGLDLPQLTCTDEMRTNMFQEGDYSNFFICTEGINYAPIAYSYLYSKYSKKMTSASEKAKTKAGSSGFSGNETTPSAVLEAMATKSSTLGMDIISTAESLPEVISAAVINAINRSIQQGIGAIKARIQREVTNVRRKVTNSVNDEIDKYGPQAVFGNQTFYEQYTSD